MVWQYLPKKLKFTFCYNTLKRQIFLTSKQGLSHRISNLKRSSELFPTNLKDQFSGCVNVGRDNAGVQSRAKLSISSQLAGSAKSSSQVQRKINFLVAVEGRILHGHEQLARLTPHCGQERRLQVRALPGVSLGIRIRNGAVVSSRLLLSSTAKNWIS
jgi:hypothetical protein